MSNISSIGNIAFYPAQNINGMSGQASAARSSAKFPGEEAASGSGKINDPGNQCQTCKNRKYKDGSDEMVSFKTPTHVSPQSSAAAVRSHEQEHVTNAYSKAASSNGKVVSATVSLQTSVCPECGRSYVSGGTTNTQIKYYNEKNPYQQDLKATDSIKYRGMNADYIA